MSSKTIFPLLVLASAIVLTVALDPGPSHPLQLTLVGFVDGRTFFADTLTSARTSWAAARNRCLAAGLKPAEISTLGQYSFLMTSLPTVAAPYGYWTGGKYSVPDYLNRLGWLRNDGASNDSNVELCLFVRKSAHLTTAACTAANYPLCHV